MREAGTRVQAHCRKCKVALKVDLDVLCTLKGRSYSLIGVTTKCKVLLCDGTMFFLASPGPGTPYRPLFEDEPIAASPPSPPHSDDDPPPSAPASTAFRRRA